MIIDQIYTIFTVGRLAIHRLVIPTVSSLGFSTDIQASKLVIMKEKGSIIIHELKILK